MKLKLTLLMTLSTLTLTHANIINSEPLDIDGQYERPRSGSDRMKVLRERIEKRTEQLVQKQIQTMRLKSEMKLQKDLQNAFNQQMNALKAIN